MSIGNRMRGLGESVYYLDDLKPKMDELMGDVSYELNHEVGKRKLLVRLDGFGEEYKPQIETLMDEELPVGYRMEYDPFPLDFIRLDFLESTGTQTIDTQQHILYSWHVVCDVDIVKRTYFHQIWGWRDGFGNQESLGYWVLPPTTSDSMSFMYDFQEKRVYKKPETVGRVLVNYIGSEAKVYIGADSLTFTKKDDYETELIAGLFAGHRINGVNDYCPAFCRIFSFMAEDGSGAKRINYVPALDSAGIPCMFDLVTKQPFYNQGTGQFIAGLTMKQALNLAKLPMPSGNNKLTISLPKEATLVQHNQEVEAALNTAAEKGWNIAVQYRDNFDDESIINKYAECATVAEMAVVNPDWKNDLTSEGEWLYNLTSLKEYGVFADNHKITVFNADLCDAYHSVYTMFRGCVSLREVHGDFSNFRSAMAMCNGCANLSVFTPVMPLLPTHYNGPSWVFDGCILNKQSVLSFLGALPAANRSLGMGIHCDHQHDEEVLAAITRMEENGWTMMIQWNGTPTAQSASTLGLRKSPIYAKIDTMECPDRTEENFLDWGHYVTNWKENGYQEFTSIEEAEDYFNIKKEISE